MWVFANHPFLRQPDKMSVYLFIRQLTLAANFQGSEDAANELPDYVAVRKVDLFGVHSPLNSSCDGELVAVQTSMFFEITQEITVALNALRRSLDGHARVFYTLFDVRNSNITKER